MHLYVTHLANNGYIHPFTMHSIFAFATDIIAKWLFIFHNPDTARALAPNLREHTHIARYWVFDLGILSNYAAQRVRSFLGGALFLYIYIYIHSRFRHCALCRASHLVSLVFAL